MCPCLAAAQEVLDAHSWESHLESLPLDAMIELATAAQSRENVMRSAQQLPPAIFLDFGMEQDPVSEDGRDGVAAVKVLPQGVF